MTMPAPDDWHYSGDPSSTPLDEVRFWCQDTDPAVRWLSDTEITFVTTVWIGTFDPEAGWQGGPYDHPLMAAHACALRIAAKVAGWSTVDADGVEVDLSGLQARYEELARQLKNEYEQLTETSADIDYTNLLFGATLDPSIAPLDFGIGMHDNPAAGRQEYGGSAGALDYELTVNESSP